MQILLHWLGPRVKNLKGQGLFSKNPGADRYAGGQTASGPSDLDRAALDEGVS